MLAQLSPVDAFLDLCGSLNGRSRTSHCVPHVVYGALDAVTTANLHAKEHLNQTFAKYNRQKDQLDQMTANYAQEKDLMKQMTGKYAQEKDQLDQMTGKYAQEKDQLKQMTAKYAQQKNQLSQMTGKYTQEKAKYDQKKVVLEQLKEQLDVCKGWPAQAAQCMGLLAIDASSADACQQVCCRMGKKYCNTWQYRESHGCWLGKSSSSSCDGDDGWVGGQAD